MNEKTPNVQTQTAMTQAREMARNRMLKLVEPRNGVESFPNFTNRARQRWESIPADIRKRLLSNVWCGHCNHETTITNFTGTIKGGDLLLVGQCAECRNQVARVIEGSQSGQASNPATTSGCAIQSVGSGFHWN